MRTHLCTALMVHWCGGYKNKVDHTVQLDGYIGQESLILSTTYTVVQLQCMGMTRGTVQIGTAGGSIVPGMTRGTIECLLLFLILSHWIMLPEKQSGYQNAH